MENEPNGGALPVIAAGALMVACRAAPVLFGVAGASVLAWFSGFGLGEMGVVALLAAVLVYGTIRLRHGKNAAASIAVNPSRSIETSL